MVKYTPQFGNNAATVGPSPRYNPLTPSLRAIFFKLSIVLIYVESLSVDTCNLVFKTSKGQTITAAIAPDVAPDTQFTTPVSDKGRYKDEGRRAAIYFLRRSCASSDEIIILSSSSSIFLCRECDEIALLLRNTSSLSLLYSLSLSLSLN